MSRITHLPKDYIFVFGSNEGGYHGAGAAADAVKYFGAIYRNGEGLQGRSYAIPTKSKTLRTLSLGRIRHYVRVFLWDALENPQLTYVVTAIGCGLAGYEPKDIAPMFKDAPRNVQLPDEFLPYV